LAGGESFGDLALKMHKPRMASIRTLEDTHFAVLSREEYERSLGQIDRKKVNEKIAFLRSLPFFQLLTKTSLSKLTPQFRQISTIKGQYLYREGEQADSVYLVKSGQFEVTKTLVERNTGLSVIISNPGKNAEQ